MSESKAFSAEQKHYLQGFAMGSDVARAVQGLPVLSGNQQAAGVQVQLGGAKPEIPPGYTGPEIIHAQAQEAFRREGKQLSNEEKAKREKNPLDMWDQLQRQAAAAEFPKGTDVFLYKYQGLFYVSPAQNSYMCRLRIPGGALSSYQLRGIADLAKRYAGGYADVTTRANLQLREIGPADPVHVLTQLQELGIVTRGSGADNVRNITCSPLSGFDSQELIETLPLAKEMHYHILHHRELYGLPRKFNIAYDGGGAISSLDETNDIGFHAVRVPAEQATEELPAGVYFQLTLGGITGHQDFARPTGVLLKPQECTPVATAVLKVFIAHGDRTDRKKARLKYLLDAWGFDRFLQEVEKQLGRSLTRCPLEANQTRYASDRAAHIGFHPQAQAGKSYLGVVLPAGRLTVKQLEGLAALSEQYGAGEVRLTVWQNLIIPHLDNDRLEDVKSEIKALGLDWGASPFRSGLVACTGNAGCKYAASDTKAHALQLAEYLEERIRLDQPINIHLTGCHHSCAQHYIGDIGLLATKVDVNDELVEGYHVYIGGGFGEHQGIGKEVASNVPFPEVPPLLARLLETYLQNRELDESFVRFCRRYPLEELSATLHSSTLPS